MKNDKAYKVVKWNPMPKTKKRLKSFKRQSGVGFRLQDHLGDGSLGSDDVLDVLPR
jgi:hypothetical protein